MENSIIVGLPNTLIELINSSQEPIKGLLDIKNKSDLLTIPSNSDIQTTKIKTEKSNPLIKVNLNSNKCDFLKFNLIRKIKTENIKNIETNIFELQKCEQKITKLYDIKNEKENIKKEKEIKEKFQFEMKTIQNDSYFKFLKKMNDLKNSKISEKGKFFGKENSLNFTKNYENNKNKEFIYKEKSFKEKLEEREMIMKKAEKEENLLFNFGKRSENVSQNFENLNNNNETENIFEEKVKQKKKKNKFVKVNKETLRDLLFDIFDKKEFIGIGELISLTMQPTGYLKEVLEEICDYNVDGNFSKKYSLKSKYKF